MQHGLCNSVKEETISVPHFYLVEYQQPSITHPGERVGHMILHNLVPRGTSPVESSGQIGSIITRLLFLMIDFQV